MHILSNSCGERGRGTALLEEQGIFNILAEKTEKTGLKLNVFLSFTQCIHTPMAISSSVGDLDWWWWWLFLSVDMISGVVRAVEEDTWLHLQSRDYKISWLLMVVAGQSIVVCRDTISTAGIIPTNGFWQACSHTLIWYSQSPLTDTQPPSPPTASSPQPQPPLLKGLSLMLLYTVP